MKLTETTYNEKYPSFNIRAMNPKGEGVPMDQSVTIQLVDEVFMWNEKPLSGPLLVKEIPKRAGGSFTVNEMTGKVVSDNVDNMSYSSRGEATFNITGGVANKILALCPIEKLGGKTLKFTLVEETKDLPKKDEQDQIVTDDDGKWVMESKTFMTFSVSEVLEDGSEKKEGGNTPSSIPPPIAKMNEEVSKEEFTLTDPEKAIFKAVRTESKLGAWKDFGQKDLVGFKQMMEAVSDYLSLPNSSEERHEGLFKRFLE